MYERYLKEVVDALETDQDFRKKLDAATAIDIRVLFYLKCYLFSNKIFSHLVWQNS